MGVWVCLVIYDYVIDDAIVIDAHSWRHELADNQCREHTQETNANTQKNDIKFYSPGILLFNFIVLCICVLYSSFALPLARPLSHRDSNMDITFHFYGGKRDSIRIHNALHKMVERGRLGNISWNPALFDFKQEAALQIMVSCCCCCSRQTHKRA